MRPEEEQNYLRYNEIRAKKVTLWGTPREQKLAGAIAKHLPVKAGLLLEAGAGDGYLLNFLDKHDFDFKYHAIDISETRTQRIKEHVPFCDLVIGNITNLPYKDNTFDLTICSETLEHIPDYQKAISEIFRVTKQNGYVLITVPNSEQLRTIDCPHCGKEFYEWGHVASFDIKSLKNLINNAGGRGKIVTLDSQTLILRYCKRIASFLLRKPELRKPSFLLCCAKKIINKRVPKEVSSSGI
jgi:SAM-dependent methyltransferase